MGDYMGGRHSAEPRRRFEGVSGVAWSTLGCAVLAVGMSAAALTRSGDGGDAADGVSQRRLTLQLEHLHDSLADYVDLVGDWAGGSGTVARIEIEELQNELQDFVDCHNHNVDEIIANFNGRPTDEPLFTCSVEFQNLFGSPDRPERPDFDG